MVNERPGERPGPSDEAELAAALVLASYSPAEVVLRHAAQDFPMAPQVRRPGSVCGQCLKGLRGGRPGAEAARG